MRNKLALVAAAAMSLAALAAAPAASASSTPLIIVYMENHGLSQVVGNANMPYLNALWGNPSVEQFTQFYAVVHSSFPNYGALATGKDVGSSASRAGQYSTPTLWAQLSKASVGWRVYQESVPGNCFKTATFNDTTSGSPGQYQIGHNPAMPFKSIASNSAKCNKVVPLSSLSSPPAVSFVTPNYCDDMHGVSSSVASQFGYTQCVTGTAALLKRGDAWLMSNVPQWTAAGADVLIMFDEGAGGDHTGVNGTSGGGHVYAVLTGPGVTGGTNAGQYNAYSVLAGIEGKYGLPLLGNAAGANPVLLP